MIYLHLNYKERPPRSSLIQVHHRVPRAARGPSWKIGDSAYKSMIKNQRVLQAKDLVPNITQKGVDLRIGLDIARLSLRQLVSTIVVVTGDSDLIPAFKFARREGLRIVLDAMGHSIRRDLKAHADITI